MGNNINGPRGRFIILSGPSCVGKGPLHHAFKQFYPDIAESLRKLVLYNSRKPRPGETDGVDYHFRKRAEIESLRDNERYLVVEVRADIQALDLDDLEKATSGGNAFFEGNPFLVRQMLKHVKTETTTVFLSPLSAEEIRFLKEPDQNIDLHDFVTEVMRKKLLRRTKRQKTNLSLNDLQDIERRARGALREMAEAWRFDYVIPNHDGEDSENWNSFYYPIGDARKTLLSFIDLVKVGDSSSAEKWQRSTVGDIDSE